MGKLIHKVDRDDNWHSISRKYGVPAYIIAKENNLKKLRQGVRLIIPEPSGVRYVVKPFDNLERISKENEIDIDSLRANNNGIQEVFVGQIIYLPYK